MKKYYLLFFLLGLQFFAYPQPIQKMKAGELSAYIAKSAKPLIVSFWATWCGSCVEEIPYFISTIKEKYGSDVELLLVSLDIKSYYPKKIITQKICRKYPVKAIRSISKKYRRSFFDQCNGSDRKKYE